MVSCYYRHIEILLIMIPDEFPNYLTVETYIGCINYSDFYSILFFQIHTLLKEMSQFKVSLYNRIQPTISSSLVWCNIVNSRLPITVDPSLDLLRQVATMAGWPEAVWYSRLSLLRYCWDGIKVSIYPVQSSTVC